MPLLYAKLVNYLKKFGNRRYDDAMKAYIPLRRFEYDETAVLTVIPRTQQALTHSYVTSTQCIVI